MVDLQSTALPLGYRPKGFGGLRRNVRAVKPCEHSCIYFRRSSDKYPISAHAIHRAPALHGAPPAPTNSGRISYERTGGLVFYKRLG